MNRILLYTFNKPDHISYRISNSLFSNESDRYYLGSLSNLKKILDTNKYDCVIGLGDNSSGLVIKIETLYINKFGELQIIQGSPDFIESNMLLDKVDVEMISDRPFGGFCNRAAYCVAETISRKKLKAKHVFIHIPSKVNLSKIEQEMRQIVACLTC